MKTRIILMVAFLFVGSLVARSTGHESYNQTYTFKNVPAGFDLSDYHAAMQNSDFECYRFENQRRTFVFDNGIQLEIFSADEIRQNTSHVSNCFLPDNTVVSSSILSLGTGNTIIMVMESGQKSNRSR